MDPSNDEQNRGLVAGMGHDFLRQVFCYYEGALPPAELKGLEAALREAPAAREAFVRLGLTRTALLEKVRQASQTLDPAFLASDSGLSTAADLNDAMILPAIAATSAEDAPPPNAVSDPRTPHALAESGGTLTRSFSAPSVPKASPRSRWWSRAAIILLPLAVVVALLAQKHSGRASATLSAATHDQWDTPTAPGVGGSLPSGPLSLKSGMAEFRLENGVRIVAEGPSRFEIRSDRLVSLAFGKLTVIVSQSGHGFAVQTPSSRVVDLGTEFGVMVDAAGGSETHVIRGTVECTPGHGENAVRLTEDQALQVDPDGGWARPIACRKGDFVESLPAIDLVDVVAGGDGTQHRRNAGVSLVDGSAVAASSDDDVNDRLEQETRIVGDGKFHPCPGRPLIGGVFIPHGGSVADVIDPAGDRFNFPLTDNRCFYWLWAGGRIAPVPEIPAPSRIGGTDYGSIGHGFLLMHANKGISFDLEAMRKAHPGRPFAHFRAVCANAASAVDAPDASERAEFWIMVDGRSIYRKSPLARSNPPFAIDAPIDANARYLTLAATDGGDGIMWDWVILGDPRLE